MNKTINFYYIAAAIILFILVVNLIFIFVTPEEIVHFIGVENSYFITFIIASIGGLSSFTGAILFSSIIVFAAGGSEPFLLGLVGGLGIFISDSVFYLLARFGRRAISKKYSIQIDNFLVWFKKTPEWIVFLFVYLYLGFTPLPADILMIAIAFAGVSYKRIFPILFLASLTIAMLTAHLGEFWGTLI